MEIGEMISLLDNIIMLKDKVYEILIILYI